MAMLEVKNLGISFGGLRAVDDFHISIEKGQLYGLLQHVFVPVKVKPEHSLHPVPVQ